MFANKKSEKACQIMMYCGGAAVFFSLVMVLTVLIGGKGQPFEKMIRAGAYLLMGGGCGVFGLVGYLGVRPKTGKVYRLASFLMGGGLFLQFISAMFLYLQVTALMPSIFLLGTMLIGLLGLVFIVYVGADAAQNFYQRSNDEIFLIVFMVGSTIVSFFALMSAGKGGVLSVIEAICLFIVGVLRFAVPIIYVKFVDCIRNPYSQEEVDEELARRAEIRRIAREEKARKKEEERRAKEEKKAEEERKKAEEAARKAEEERKAQEEAARKAEEERKAKEEAARKAEEARKEAARKAEEARKEAARKAEEARKEAARKVEEARKEAERKAEEERKAKEEATRKAEEERKAEEARIAAEKAAEARKQAEKDATTNAKEWAMEEAARLAPAVFGCSLEEWKNK